MQQGAFKLSCADLKHLEEKEKECIDEVLCCGQLSDEFMDRLDIIRMQGDTAEFSDKVYNQQHAHCVSHEQSKARYIGYRQRKADAADPDKKAIAAELAAAQKPIEKTTKGKAKSIERENKKRKREEMGADELLQLKESEKRTHKEVSERRAAEKAAKYAAAMEHVASSSTAAE